MTRLKLIFVWLLLAIMPAVPVLAADSAEDADLSVTPVIRQFPVTTLGTTSTAAEFTIKNNHATDSRTLGTIILDGTNASEFVIGSHACSGATLAAGESCSVPVSFAPLTRGTKVAELRIPSNDSETPVLTAYVTNTSDTLSEAQLLPRPQRPGGNKKPDRYHDPNTITYANPFTKPQRDSDD